MKKFILLIPSMNNGGAERVMATIANNLCTEHKVQIVTMTDTESFYSLDENVAITGLGQNVNRHNKLTLLFSMATGGIKAFFSLKKKINIEKPDAVLSFLQSANMMAILLKMFGGRFRLVVSERCAPEERDFFNRFFEKYFYSKADVIVCQSEKVINFFREKDRKKITLIPNPIAASAIPPRFEGKRRHTIVGVGRLSDQKNFEMLINAFSALPDKFSDYTLEIYGSGPFEERLKTLIEKKGLTGKAA